MTRAPNLPDGAEGRISRLIHDGIARHDRNQIVRRRIVSASVAAIIIASGSGFAWVVVASHSQQARSAFCYGANSLNARYTQVGLPNDEIGRDGKPERIATPADEAASAIDLCDSAWRAGIFGAKAAPPLTVCIQNDDVLALFPKRVTTPVAAKRFCDNLGLGTIRG